MVIYKSGLARRQSRRDKFPNRTIGPSRPREVTAAGIGEPIAEAAQDRPKDATGRRGHSIRAQRKSAFELSQVSG